MDEFKTWYNDKKGKMILFFGFYLIFFIFLAFYVRNLRDNERERQMLESSNEIEASSEKEASKETIITTYNISNLINNDYDYVIDIMDDGENIKFTGSKNNVDYANYANKYFLDIYNINQLLKRSVLIKSSSNVLTYELKNSEINDILLTEREEGINNIIVYTNDKGEVNRIDLGLSSYFKKDIFQISINYTIGEKNENSSS